MESYLLMKLIIYLRGRRKNSYLSTSWLIFSFWTLAMLVHGGCEEADENQVELLSGKTSAAIERSFTSSSSQKNRADSVFFLHWKHNQTLLATNKTESSWIIIAKHQMINFSNGDSTILSFSPANPSGWRSNLTDLWSAFLIISFKLPIFEFFNNFFILFPSGF